MKTLTGNIFVPDTYQPQVKKIDAICLTTNGFVKADGEAVMGRGVAKQAYVRWPKIATALGVMITKHGNNVQVIGKTSMYAIVAFPVKPVSAVCDRHNVVEHLKEQFKVGSELPGWACRADINLIIQSTKQLVMLANRMKWKRIVLPKPGCGAGELMWAAVQPALVSMLDNRFYVIDRPIKG